MSNRAMAIPPFCESKARRKAKADYFSLRPLIRSNVALPTNKLDTDHCFMFLYASLPPVFSHNKYVQYHSYNAVHNSHFSQGLKYIFSRSKQNFVLPCSIIVITIVL